MLSVYNFRILHIKEALVLQIDTVGCGGATRCTVYCWVNDRGTPKATGQLCMNSVLLCLILNTYINNM